MGRYKNRSRFRTPQRKHIFDKEKVIETPLSEDSRILTVYRGKYRITRRGKRLLEVVEFTVSYELLIDEKWEWTRRHCWMEHSESFHTHVRLGKSKRKSQKIIQGWKRTIKSALNWSRKDMKQNWQGYRRNYLKRLKVTK